MYSTERFVDVKICQKYLMRHCNSKMIMMPEVSKLLIKERLEKLCCIYTLEYYAGGKSTKKINIQYSGRKMCTYAKSKTK